jgi:hypothetical protein
MLAPMRALLLLAGALAVAAAPASGVLYPVELDAKAAIGCTAYNDVLDAASSYLPTIAQACCADIEPSNGLWPIERDSTVHKSLAYDKTVAGGYGWIKRPDVKCKVQSSTRYKSQTDALRACGKNPNCRGIQNTACRKRRATYSLCSGEEGKEYAMEDVDPKYSNGTPMPKSCIIQRPSPNLVFKKHQARECTDYAPTIYRRMSKSLAMATCEADEKCIGVEHRNCGAARPTFRLCAAASWKDDDFKYVDPADKKTCVYGKVGQHSQMAF